ncbi:hypothetical protein GCM10010515_59280 [Streptomyces fructofermentans]|uniref:Uncharacterized protein n=1 Tax=Streptomyces fructofermentans TaxID=152141 RepID=A0A918U2W1_9ACTN|nr:hypothetical protein GCM10010515_59280 [Streptomyces fructofermentans]
MPYSDATSEYCAWVRPRGAIARSTATRHFMDRRHTRKPGVAPSGSVLTDALYMDIVYMAAMARELRRF